MSNKIIFTSIMLTVAMLFGTVFLVGCMGGGNSNSEPIEDGGILDEEDENINKGSESNTETDTKKESETDKKTEATVIKTEISPTVYDVSVVKSAAQTTAGSFEAWKNEVVKGGENNDDPTTDAIIESPFHTLEVNGELVPVYTARCGKGAHSFAWVDVTAGKTFELEVVLELSEDFGKCVILPEGKGVSASIDGKQVQNVITEEGSYTYTFAKSADAAVTDPAFAPMTLMITRASTQKIPSSYKIKYIEPGYHADSALEFTQSNTAYIMKKGLHQISSIGLPSNSMLIIEQGAYLQASDRQVNGVYNTNTVIHADDCQNVKIISRGILDCGLLKGGDNKYKHPINTARSKYVTIEGLTVVNSNTWTICAYLGTNININKNLLLSYRTYSDGIMMSECVNSAGRYNFVRTGDDAIEFKGTSWWGTDNYNVGKNCIYEYNDVWTDKGVGYGVIWESACRMDGMIFRNNNIGFAQSNWTERNAAIDCHLGTNAATKWSNITFENIEIYHVGSPNVLSVRVVETGGIFENITFKNITVKSVANGTYAFRMHFDAKGGSISGIKIESMSFCGKKLTATDKNDTTLFSNKATEFFDSLTVS